MFLSKLGCGVAFAKECNNATAMKSAISHATATEAMPSKPLSLNELRAQLRSQPVRNQLNNHEDEKQPELRTSKVGTGDTQLITSWGWLIHYADREPVECYICPVVTHAELMKLRPDAIGAEPLPEIQEPIEVRL